MFQDGSGTGRPGAALRDQAGHDQVRAWRGAVRADFSGMRKVTRARRTWGTSKKVKDLPKCAFCHSGSLTSVTCRGATTRGLRPQRHEPPNSSSTADYDEPSFDTPERRRPIFEADRGARTTRAPPMTSETSGQILQAIQKGRLPAACFTVATIVAGILDRRLRSAGACLHVLAAVCARQSGGYWCWPPCRLVLRTGDVVLFLASLAWRGQKCA